MDDEEADQGRIDNGHKLNDTASFKTIRLKYRSPLPMTIRHFRLLLIASVVFHIISCIDFVLPTLLPEEFHQAQALYDATLSTSRILFLGFVGFWILGMWLVSVYGLYTLRHWAPQFSLVWTVLLLVGALVQGVFAQSGLASMMAGFAGYTWGAVLVFALYPPFNAHFQRRES
ncbi:MAG: hypothetical protein LBQ75_06680 [Zoogloeaceae bacterium]|jgi:hypothetical protein|nr:hypothetical protein [Zoogloeaceae bacterium]